VAESVFGRHCGIYRLPYGLGDEAALNSESRVAIEFALGRPIQWLEIPSKVDAALQETTRPLFMH